MWSVRPRDPPMLERAGAAARGIRGMLNPPRGIDMCEGRGARPPCDPPGRALASSVHTSPTARVATNVTAPQVRFDCLYMGSALTSFTQRVPQTIHMPVAIASLVWRMSGRCPKLSPDIH